MGTRKHTYARMQQACCTTGILAEQGTRKANGTHLLVTACKFALAIRRALHRANAVHASCPCITRIRRHTGLPTITHACADEHHMFSRQSAVQDLPKLEAARPRGRCGGQSHTQETPETGQENLVMLAARHLRAASRLRIPDVHVSSVYFSICVYGSRCCGRVPWLLPQPVSRCAVACIMPAIFPLMPTCASICVCPCIQSCVVLLVIGQLLRAALSLERQPSVLGRDR
jgi:hypothetical protein